MREERDKLHTQDYTVGSEEEELLTGDIVAE